jgi:acyl carrier protein
MTTLNGDLLRILREQFPSLEDPKGDDRLIEDLGADEIDLLEFRDRVEEAFPINIKMYEDDWAKCATVNDFAAFLKRHAWVE